MDVLAFFSEAGPPPDSGLQGRGGSYQRADQSLGFSLPFFQWPREGSIALEYMSASFSPVHEKHLSWLHNRGRHSGCHAVVRPAGVAE